jgi:hypothetical protein
MQKQLLLTGKDMLGDAVMVRALATLPLYTMIVCLVSVMTLQTCSALHAECVPYL